MNTDKQKILISACLLGHKVRYDGKIKKIDHLNFLKWLGEKILIPFCPECSSGLQVPRPCAEIIGGDGESVIKGLGKVINIHGEDVSKPFIKGAFNALSIAKKNQVLIAILKEKSPSCGSKFIYDGTFSGVIKPGKGVTCALLEENSIKVYSEIFFSQV